MKVLGVPVVEARSPNQGPAPASHDIPPATRGPETEATADPYLETLARASPLEESLDTALRGDELALPPADTKDRSNLTPTVGAVEVLRHYDSLPNATHVPVATAPDSSAAEDYRVLRQKLRVGGPMSGVLALASSSEPGLSSEVAINLALAFGEDEGAPVLVVDANFGSPMLSKVLGVSPPECFASQMRGVLHLATSEKTWVAMSVGFQHVHVLAIEPESDPATRRFDPPAFRAALNALRSSGAYSLVLVDLPPPLRSSGFNLAGDLVDGVVLAGVTRTTRGRDLRLAAERLAPVPVLGTVLFR